MVQKIRSCCQTNKQLRKTTAAETIMEIGSEQMQHHCRTCLTQIDYDAVVFAAPDDQFWMLPPVVDTSSAVTKDGQWCNYMPQQLCHECNQTIQLANEFRTKVQRAEQQLLAMEHQQEELPRSICCSICQRRYLAAVKSLTCRVRDAPHLREWLTWSSGGTSEHTDAMETWSAHTVCRFCYAHLRDCYEWHLAAVESAEYLRKFFAGGASSTVETSKSWMGGYHSEFKDATSEAAPYMHVDPLNDEEPLLLEPIVKLEYGGHYAAAAQYNADSAVKAPHRQQNFIDFMEPLETLPSPRPSVRTAATIPKRKRIRNDHDDSDADWTLPSSSSARDNYQQPAKRKMYKSKKQQRLSFASTCYQCQQRFNKPLLLEAHILHVHQGKSKPFLCKYCTHAYITHSHLKRHLKTSHRDKYLQEEGDSSKYEYLHL